MSPAVIARISALTRRDLTIELSYQFQLFLRLWTILISVAMFYFLGALMGNPPELDAYGGSYFEFALIGLVVMGFSQACVKSFSESIQRSQADGTLEILLSTATRLPTLMGGTLVVPLLFAMVEATIFLVTGIVVSDMRFPLAGLFIAAPILLLTLGAFAAIGVLSATVIVLTKRGDPFSTLVLQASNLLAGAVFPVAVLPDALQLLARAMPAFYGLRGVREVLLTGGGLADVRTDLLALAAFNIVLLPMAMWALSRAIRLARVTGTLGNR